MENLLQHVRRVTVRHEVAVSAAVAIVGFVGLDRLLRRFARVPIDRLGDESLLLAAIRSEWLVALLGVIAVVVVGPRRVVAVRWTDVGEPLRIIALVFVAILVWRRVTAPYDFLYEQWHLADRVLLVVGAAFATARPLGVLPFVVMSRLLAAPVVESVFAPGRNIDALPLLLLTALVASTLLVAAVPRYRAVAVVPAMLAAVAAQFWLPGWTKLRSGWAWNNDLTNLPLNGYGQGWLGDGSGSLSQRYADLLEPVEPVILVGTLLLELAAIVVMARRQMARSWLLAIVAFHVATLFALGFVFFEFVVVELALVVALGLRAGREWTADAFTGMTPVVTGLAVLFGATLFEPPTLAWYDTNAVSRIDIDGIDTDGTRWALEPDDFAPYSGVMAFAALPVEPGRGVVDGYGSAGRVRFEALRGVETFDEVAAIEATNQPDCDRGDVAVAINLLDAFVAETQVDRFRSLPQPPAQFQISRPGDDYDFSVPIVSLEVTRVTLLRVDGQVLERVEPVDWERAWC